VLDEIKRLLTELPLEGSRRLFELWRQIPERRTGQAGDCSPYKPHTVGCYLFWFWGGSLVL